MGQIKNIKLHIVTDIKGRIICPDAVQDISNLFHHDVQLVQNRSPRVAKCCSCVSQTTNDRQTCSCPHLYCFGTNFIIAHVHTCPRHRSCCKIHRSRSCYRRCCWIWCWYRNSFRKFDHRIRQKPFIETTAVLIRYSWICVVRSYGTFLPYDGFLDSSRRFFSCQEVVSICTASLQVFSAQWMFSGWQQRGQQQGVRHSQQQQGQH